MNVFRAQSVVFPTVFHVRGKQGWTGSKLNLLTRPSSSIHGENNRVGSSHKPFPPHWWSGFSTRCNCDRIAQQLLVRFRLPWF